MKIWYVVGTVEYWLEPQYAEGKTGRVTILGCRLYDRDGKYKGWWQWKDMPNAIRQTVRADVASEIKRHKHHEKYEMQAINMRKRRQIDTE